jgi:drug/metabolite transporter (DMT)-like permease
VGGLQLFQVIYASIVVFNALLALLLLGRRLAPLQWLAIAVVVTGLMISMVGIDLGDGGEDGEGA